MTQPIISRRWFLIGSATAVAVSQVSILKAATAPESPTILPTAISTGLFPDFSRISQLRFFPMLFPDVDSDSDSHLGPIIPTTLKITREGTEDPLFKVCINPRGLFYWQAPWDGSGDLITIPSRALRFLVTPDPSKAILDINYTDRDDKPFNTVLEWDKGVALPPVTTSLYNGNVNVNDDV